MPVLVQCPNPACAAPWSLPDGSASQSFRCPRCQTLLTPSATTAGLPAVIGRYQVRAKLGAGAFGTVYRAYDPQLDREVALKVLKPEALDTPQAVERFQREARAAARMLHPNIVPVFDAGACGDSHYIASAFIAGRSLAAAIPDGGMEPRRAVALTAQLLDALAYAHAQGVLHRDVKPANALVDAQDRLYLTDFGLALWTAAESTRLTGAGAVLGTPAFIAPEQLTGGAEAVGPAADQYSAGVVLYQLLTGRLPFEGALPTVLYQAAHKAPPPPSKHRPGLDARLEAICLKAMARHSAQRFPDVAHFAEALRAWLSAPPSKAPPRKGKAPRPPSTPETEAVAARTIPTVLPAPDAARKVPTVVPVPEPATVPTVVPLPPPRRSRTARAPAPRRRGGSGAWFWIVGLGLVGVALATLGFLVLPALLRRPPADESTKKPDEPLDLKPDIDAINRAIRAGNTTFRYVRETAPRRAEVWGRAAARGLPEGEWLLGCCFLIGAVVDKDEALGATWIRKAADQDFALAQGEMGDCYRNGLGVARDPVEAVRWYRRGAEQGDLFSLSLLGLCYLNGDGVEPNADEAERWFRKAIEKDCAGGLYGMGLLSMRGDGAARASQPAEAVNWFRKAADKGSAPAKFELGYCYEKGLGVTPDPGEAFAWYRRSAEGGMADGMNQVGFCFQYGLLGVKVDAVEAVRYYRLGADEGSLSAMVNLGWCLENGVGAARDDAEAFRWYSQAADKGLPTAMTRLGICLQNGKGVARDAAKAAEWYRKAADLNDVEAMRHLALCYEQGDGVPQKLDEAARWKAKADALEPKPDKAPAP
jgi:TPR repeat protein/serine/threonine protein kinase